MKSIIGFVKKETVLSVAIVLAAISSFIVPPDIKYSDYIDFRTLGLLFCLMAVMAGMRELGLFNILAQRLLSRVSGLRATVILLWALCFFFSMIITNDVALITFVPFTIILMDMMGEEIKRKWLIPVVVMQTAAANLGSMLTPIGNPQNLYLYDKAELSLGRFILLMLPYSLLSFTLLIVWSFLLCRGVKVRAEVSFSNAEQPANIKKLLCYCALFILSLLTVSRVLTIYIPLAAVVIYLVIFDRPILLKVDYALLATFAGFFVFIGNMGRTEAFSQFLQNTISGHETITAILASQVISNVPAALLLSGFTDNSEALMIGTNIGGLGTLIASMASLISFKAIGREDKSLRYRYLIYFTAANLLFLAFLTVLTTIL